MTCHKSRIVGGEIPNKLGAVVAYETSDTGRHSVTNKDADKFFFKVPQLLNITETGPYFHDGSISDLSKVVRIMGKHQLGKDLDDAQVQSIVTFLGALKGELTGK